LTSNPQQQASRSPHLFAVAICALLAGCIDSATPILTDAQPFLGEAPHLQFYALHDGAAHEPTDQTFRWQDGRYVAQSGASNDIGDFTLHAFEGADLLVQSIRSSLPAEYAIARKLADGTYLVFYVDETDADDATRRKFCSTENGAACRVSSREAVLALARATAAKPHADGGLAVLIAPP
jgi:hypothetical protein